MHACIHTYIYVYRLDNIACWWTQYSYVHTLTKVACILLQMYTRKVQITTDNSVVYRLPAQDSV